MGRIPEWGRWLLSGSFSGTVVSALLTPTLFLVYSYQSGYWAGGDIGLVPFVAIVGAMWGAVGGLVSGAICAALTAAAGRRDRRTRSVYTAVAAGVTAVLVAVLGALQLSEGYWVDPMQFAWDLLIWIVAPAGICAGAAYAIGAWMWGSSRPSPVT